jgi:tRNA-dihydrouridine synthase A
MLIARRPAHLVSIAPMMDCTDRHERYFLRLIAPDVLLYTEMITTGALIYGDQQRFLAFDALEHPLALQLGGSDPQALATCARLAESWGYDEVNLNVGCPSDRVKSGHFGACLMLAPELVADSVRAMSEAVSIPVTVKCRIGVDDHDSYAELAFFIEKVSVAGCKTFIIHARKAWLSGLSPKQNREVPPLKYAVVHQIKQDFPHLTIIINGGIKSLAQVQEQLQWVDGVMIGREAYSNPYSLAEIQRHVFGARPEMAATRQAAVEKFLPYLAEQLKNNVKLSSMTRHILGLFQGEKGARYWRRYISENAYKTGANVDIVLEAMRLTNE